LNEVVIVSALRTAIGTFGGTLSQVPASKLGAVVIKEAVKRVGIDSNLIDEVIMEMYLGLVRARISPARHRFTQDSL